MENTVFGDLSELKYMDLPPVSEQYVLTVAENTLLMLTYYRCLAGLLHVTKNRLRFFTARS